MDLLHLCLTSTYFQYNGKRYKQLQRTAMGSPVSVVVVKIVIQNRLPAQVVETSVANVLKIPVTQIIIFNQNNYYRSQHCRQLITTFRDLVIGEYWEYFYQLVKSSMKKKPSSSSPCIKIALFFSWK